MNDAVDGGGGVLVPLRARDLELVVFDLDGVLTRTARIHAAAWKELFDRFLEERCGAGFVAFDATADYLGHVDGKPRLDGVRDFLASRGITVPEGSPDDEPGTATVWGLGNAKNDAFNAVLDREGVETYPPAVALVERLEACGIRRAVVSASRNCRRVLEAAGLAGRFDAVVDGEDAAREGLAGKPAPDTFLHAALRLGIAPSRAAVIEDAEAGVAAARAGHFGLVVGVDRGGHAEALRERGAHHVVQTLEGLHPEPLPSALDRLEEIVARLAGRTPVLFLDYDGTLTPIVDRPEDAALGDPMRETLTALAERCTVVLVTGRGLESIRDLVRVDGIVYAADHGFQIERPGQSPVHPEAVAGFEELVADVTRRLAEGLAGVRGALVEPKRFSVAVHYRLVADDEVAAVKSMVRDVLWAEPRLRLLPGKKVLELQPDVDWNKAAAVRWVMESDGIALAQAIYVGDDVTDEAAFRLLREEGTAVAVQEAHGPTGAAYRLAGVDEVREFLRRVAGDAPAP